MKRKLPKLGVASNQRAASALTKLPLGALKLAKDAGCPAFRIRGDVDCDALMKWVDAHPEVFQSEDGTVDKQKEEALKIRAERKLKEYKLAEWEGEFIPLETVKQWGADAGSKCKRKVVTLHLIAPTLYGKPVDIIEKLLLEKEDEILKSFQNMGGKMKV